MGLEERLQLKDHNFNPDRRHFLRQIASLVALGSLSTLVPGVLRAGTDLLQEGESRTYANGGGSASASPKLPDHINGPFGNLSEVFADLEPYGVRLGHTHEIEGKVYEDGTVIMRGTLIDGTEYRIDGERYSIVQAGQYVNIEKAKGIAFGTQNSYFDFIGERDLRGASKGIRADGFWIHRKSLSKYHFREGSDTSHHTVEIDQDTGNVVVYRSDLQTINDELTFKKRGQAIHLIREEAAQLKELIQEVARYQLNDIAYASHAEAQSRNPSDPIAATPARHFIRLLGVGLSKPENYQALTQMRSRLHERIRSYFPSSQ